VLEQLGNALRFFAFFTASRIGKTGLSDVTVDVFNPAGTKIVTAATVTGELTGSGVYYYDLASGSVSAKGEYLAIFKTADATVDAKHMPSLWVVNRAGIENLDAPISSVSPASGTYSVTIQVQLGNGTPIADVWVAIYNSTETLLQTAKATDSLGRAVVSLNADTYKVRLRKAGYSFTVPETVVVVTSATFTFTGTQVAIGVPSTINTCRVYEWCFAADDVTPVASVIAQAAIVRLPYDYDGKLHVGVIVTGTYSATTGLVYWDLVYGATVDFSIPAFGVKKRKVVIPSFASVRLSSL
jgi:hypothetical protein